MTNQADKPSVEGLKALLFGSEDEPAKWRCALCGRKSWDVAEEMSYCGMPQPDGEKCAGLMRAERLASQSAAEELPPIAPVAWELVSYATPAEDAPHPPTLTYFPDEYPRAVFRPLVAAPPSALLLEVLKALQRSNEWLATYPAGGTMSVTGPYEQSRAAIAKLREWMGEKT